MTFDEFLKHVHTAKPIQPFRGRLLALDPGETTGWSVWDSHDNCTRYELEGAGQLATWDKDRHSINSCVINFQRLLDTVKPDRAVLETYRVYEWKAESHAWSDVPTLRIIGSMETRLIDLGIPYSFQTAQVAKNFVTDDRLKEWSFYKRGERHSRDSMRHGLYYLLFGQPASTGK